MTVRLTHAQRHWAQAIIARVKAHKLPGDQGERAADIALATALTESNLQMYANRHNAASLRIPHDAVGSDHGSVGLFQQQVGGAPHSTANWGTTAQCMDVNHSTDSFLRGLLRTNWLHMTNWDAAQKVQGSFDPTGGNYKRNNARAIEIRQALWGVVATPSAPVVHPAPVKTPPAPPKRATTSHGVVGTWTVHSGDNLTAIAKHYPQKWITAASIAKLNHIDNPNKIYPNQVLRIG